MLKNALEPLANIVVVKALYKLLCATAWVVVPLVIWRSGTLVFKWRATEISSQRRLPN